MADSLDALIASTPNSTVVMALAEVVQSSLNPPDTIMRLYRASGPEERAGMLECLRTMTAAGGNALMFRFIGSAGEITPELAARIPEDIVGRLIAEMQESDPGIVFGLARYYAGSPNLLHALGPETVAELISRIRARLREVA